MGIKEYRDAVLIGHPHDLPQGFEIGVVVDPALGLQTLPGTVESDGIHPPVSEVVEVVIGEGVVGAEDGEVWVEGVDFVDCIDAVVDTVAAVLIDEEWVVGVYSKGY